MGMSGARVDVHIDRLVLRGMDPQDRRAFTEAFQVELARALATPHTRAAIHASATTPKLQMGRLVMQPGAGGARTLAAGVARRVAAGISGKGRAR
jgi:hypothetical protein